MFIDSLRNEKALIHRESEEDVYQSCIDSIMENLKFAIQEQLKRTSGNVITGEKHIVTLGRIALYGGSDFIQNKNSDLYSISTYGDNTYLHVGRLCTAEYKNGLFSTQVKVSLTMTGRRTIAYLERKAKDDGFEILFFPRITYPLYDGSHSYGEKNLSAFDVYERVPRKGKCDVYLRYRIVL